MKRKIVIAAAIAAIAAVRLAEAATITVKPLGSGMPPAVFVTGEIVEGDADRFRIMTASLPQAIVVLRSPGGSAAEGVGISGIIRENGYTTYVASGSLCASACGIAWLGGARRAMSINARIGFHAAYFRTAFGTEDAGGANAILGAFLAKELGLPLTAVAYVTRQSGPDHLEWLNPGEARQVGIEMVVFESRGTPVTPAAYAPLMPSGAVLPYTLPASQSQPAYRPRPVTTTPVHRPAPAPAPAQPPARPAFTAAPIVGDPDPWFSPWPSYVPPPVHAPPAYGPAYVAAPRPYVSPPVYAAPAMPRYAMPMARPFVRPFGGYRYRR